MREGSAIYSAMPGKSYPQRIRNARINDGFFPMFGARPAVGRLFQESDFRAAGPAVLSYGTWIRLFGGDSTIVGKSIVVDGESRTVIGVTSAEFAAPEALVGRFVDMWQPFDPAFGPPRRSPRHGRRSRASRTTAQRLFPGSMSTTARCQRCR